MKTKIIIPLLASLSLLKELEKYKIQLQVQEKKLNELYEEARQAGVPSGWLR